ncbi:hypothetical protein V501_08604 [Pseudogymnoascus sp. VKM F-4519 (FW-2642)]|nr:hypothetical protein V501_08604 [Pseudogymnoascus sp. VKM F-4519 (FW-2642)]
MIIWQKGLDNPAPFVPLSNNNIQTYNQIKQTPTPKTNQNQPKPPNQSSWVTVDAPALLPATAEAAAPAPRAENKSLWLPNLHTSISATSHTPCGTCAMGRFDKSGWSYDGREDWNREDENGEMIC